MSLIAMLLFAGCKNAVTITGIDEFGKVRDATWVHLSTPDTEYHYVSLSTSPHQCEDLTRGYEDINELFETFFDENAGDNQAMCANFGDTLAEAADLSAWMDDGAHTMSLWLWDGDKPGADPVSGTYKTDANGLGFTGTLRYFHGNAYAVAADTWDPDTCSWDDEAYAAVNEDYVLTDSKLDLEVASEDKLRGELLGSVMSVDDDYNIIDKVGEADARFVARRCDVEMTTEGSYF